MVCDVAQQLLLNILCILGGSAGVYSNIPQIGSLNKNLSYNILYNYTVQGSAQNNLSVGYT